MEFYDIVVIKYVDTYKISYCLFCYKRVFFSLFIKIENKKIDSLYIFLFFMEIN